MSHITFCTNLIAVPVYVNTLLHGINKKFVFVFTLYELTHQLYYCFHIIILCYNLTVIYFLKIVICFNVIICYTWKLVILVNNIFDYFYHIYNNN